MKLKAKSGHGPILEDGRPVELPAGPRLPGGTDHSAPNILDDQPGLASRMDRLALEAARKQADTLYIEVARIDCLGLNPRKAFSGIEELAADVAEHGLLAPLCVRVKRGCTDRYELVAGERRLRAIKSLGWTHVAAIVRELSDGEAREIALVENVQRESLNPIEEARGLAAVLKAGGGTQEAIGKRIGKSQAWVANRLRLLDLPQPFLGQVEKGELPVSHAMEVLPWRRVPAVLKEIVQRGLFGQKYSSLSLADAKRCARRAALEQTYPLGDQDYVSGVGYVKWRIADGHGLETIEVDGPPRAIDEKAWEPLKKAALAAAIEKAKAKQGGKQNAGAKATKREPTAAERKAREKEQAEQFQRRLAAFRQDWLRCECRAAIEPQSPPRKLTREEAATRTLAVSRMLLYLACKVDTGERGGSWAGRVLSDRADWLLDAASGKPGHRGGGLHDPWRALEQKQRPQGEVECAFLAAVLWDAKEQASPCPLPKHVVEGFAAAIGIDLAARWKQHRCGPLTERYFELFTREQLEDLARGLGEFLPAGWTKAKAIEQLLARQKATWPLPSELVDRPAKR